MEFRCVSETWPAELTKEIAAAAMNFRYRSSADVDRRLIELQMTIRSTCAGALTESNNPNAQHHIERLIIAMKPLIAEFGFRGLVTLNLLETLPGAQKRAVAKWLRNPDFVLGLISDSEIDVPLKDLEVVVSKTGHLFFIAPIVLPAIIAHLKTKEVARTSDDAQYLAIEALRTKAGENLARAGHGF